MSNRKLEILGFNDLAFYLVLLISGCVLAETAVYLVPIVLLSISIISYILKLKEYIMNKKTLVVFAFGIGLMSSTAQARRYHVVDEPFFDSSWIDQMFDFHDRAVGSVRNYLDGFGPSKEDREALKGARENMTKIKYDVKEDDATVKITFTGFEHLDKKDVKVVKKDSGWLGTINLKEGRLEFFLSSQGIYVSKRIELKQETKVDPKNKDAKKEERILYSSSSATEDHFKTLVDVSTLKAQPVKPSEFVLTVEKQKEEVLHLS